MHPVPIAVAGALLELAALELFVLAGRSPHMAAGKPVAIVLYLVVVAGICWSLRHLALWRAQLALLGTVALFLVGMQLLGFFVHNGLVHDIEFGTLNHAIRLATGLGAIWAGHVVVMLVLRALVFVQHRVLRRAI